MLCVCLDTLFFRYTVLCKVTLKSLNFNFYFIQHEKNINTLWTVIQKVLIFLKTIHEISK